MMETAQTSAINHQSTVTLPLKLKGELFAYYNGPGIRGGDISKAKADWNLDVGLQRKFLHDQLQVRVSVSDIFLQAGWKGTAEFSGLVSEVDTVWDSRRLNLNLSYTFGNDNVQHRNRSTGTTKETGRVGE